MLKTAIKRIALRLGAQVSSIKHAGVDLFVDLARIRPFYQFGVIVDVGAHAGECTLEYHLRAPKARIIAVEPVIANYEKLTKAVSGLERITAVNAAMSSSEGQAMMKYGVSSQTHSLATGIASPTRAGNSGELVTKMTLEDLALKNGVQRIDFLKTDTEGHDLEVLRGSGDLLREGRIDFVLSEVTFIDDSIHTSFFEMHDLMRSNSLALVGLYDIAIAVRPGRIEFCNALFSRI